MLSSQWLAGTVQADRLNLLQLLTSYELAVTAHEGYAKVALIYLTPCLLLLRYKLMILALYVSLWYWHGGSAVTVVLCVILAMLQLVVKVATRVACCFSMPSWMHQCFACACGQYSIL